MINDMGEGDARESDLGDLVGIVVSALPASCKDFQGASTRMCSIGDDRKTGVGGPSQRHGMRVTYLQANLMGL